MKFSASTLPPDVEAGDAFPPSRHIPQIAAPTPAPRLTGKIRVVPGGNTGGVVDQAAIETPQQQGRYRVPNRLSAIRKLSVAKEEPSQVIDDNDQVKVKPTVRSFRLRPSPFRAANTKAVADPVDDARFSTDPDQPIQQRSISSQNGRPVNQFSLRKLNKENISQQQPAAETSPSKPTRRTFTRKPALATTTPANIRVTKRYYKKNGSKVETTTTESTVTSGYSSTTPSTKVKPFRVATRHQGQAKQRFAGKTKKKLDDAGEEDNYPEHFKLLLKSPKPEEKPAKFRASSPIKALRVNQRIDVGAAPAEKTVHSALRNNLRTRPRPFVNHSEPKTVPTTTATVITTEEYNEFGREGFTEQPPADSNDISIEDDRDLLSPSRLPEEVQPEKSSREGRRFEDRGPDNSRNQAAVGSNISGGNY